MDLPDAMYFKELNLDRLKRIKRIYVIPIILILEYKNMYNLSPHENTDHHQQIVDESDDIILKGLKYKVILQHVLVMHLVDT